MKNLIMILAIVSALGACTQVDTGHRGVKVYWGEVDEREGSMKEGLYWYNPITTSINELNIQVLRWEGSTNTYTKDVQQANIKFVINYRLSDTAAHTVYKEVGETWANVLLPQAVEGELKKVIGQYDAIDLVSNRGAATQKAFDSIKGSLSEKFVIIERFEMTNIEYLKDFEKAVEEKQIAVQRAIEAVNKTKQIEEEAKQKVISAKAEAESMRIRANALTQNAQLVQYEAVQKWDGKLPQYNLGSSTPFIQIK